MSNKISRLLFVTFLVYYAWYQQAIGYIPRLSTILLFGIGLFTLIEIVKSKFDFRSLLTCEMIVWSIFVVYTWISGWIIALDRELVITAIKMMAKFMLLWLYMIYISKRDRDNLFVVSSLYVMTVFQVLSALLRPFYRHERLSLGIGNNANDYANFLLLGIIVTIILSFRFKNKYFILLNTSLLLVMAYQIMLTASRQGVIGLFSIVIGSAYLLVDKQRVVKYLADHKRRLITFTTLGSVSVLAGYVLFRSLAIHRLIATIMTGQFSNRDYLFFESIQVFIDHVIFGVGIDNFQVYSKFKIFTHITWMELLSTTGLIGFTIYTVYFIVIGRFSWNAFIQSKTVKGVRDKYLNGSSLIIFALISILSFVTIHFYQMSSTLLIGIILSQKYASEQKNIC